MCIFYKNAAQMCEKEKEKSETGLQVENKQNKS